MTPVVSRRDPDARGYFGEFGGRFVPETLVEPVEELERAYFAAREDPEFHVELDRLLKDYPGSAWAHYERYQTLQAKAMLAKAALPDWTPTRKAILGADPLYGSMARATGPEVSTEWIGRAVLERLRVLDPVSYLRFASVYKGFEGIADFEREFVELQKTTAPKRRRTGS